MAEATVDLGGDLVQLLRTAATAAATRAPLLDESSTPRGGWVFQVERKDGFIDRIIARPLDPDN